MQKWIGTGLVLAVAVAAAGTLVVAKAAPEPAPVAAAKPALSPGDKPLGRICRSGEIVDSRPSPAWVGASFEKDNCRAPGMPAQVDGFTASREQVVASMAAAKNYAAASDAFERCVQKFVEARKIEADDGGRPFAAPLAIIENHRVLVSQRNQQLVAARVRNTITNFNEYGSGCEDG
jgi:hypothetical protein